METEYVQPRIQLRNDTADAIVAKGKKASKSEMIWLKEATERKLLKVNHSGYPKKWSKD